MRGRADKARRRRAIVARLVSVVGVAAVVAALLSVGSVLSAKTAKLAAVTYSGTLLPLVEQGSREAAVWNCPGPLPIGQGASAAISVVNPSGHEAILVASFAESALVPGAVSGRPLRANEVTERLAPHSQIEIGVPEATIPPGDLPPPKIEKVRSKGHGGATKTKKIVRLPAVEAAASVAVTGAQVAVEESSSSGAGLLESPCALGSARRGFIASGVTAGSSGTAVALFDPAAAPAIVDLTVATPSGPLVPDALQGIVVAPRSVAVVGLSNFVPQQPRVAVSATVRTGQIVIGSFTRIGAAFTERTAGRTESYKESGTALVVGVGRAERRWLSPLDTESRSESQAVRILDPSNRAAQVVVSSEDGVGRTATVEVTVGGGETATVSAPLPPPLTTSSAASSAPSKKHSNETASAGTGPSGSPSTSGGVLKVTSRNGVGVVVEHESYLTTGKGHVLLISTAPSGTDSPAWLIPREGGEGRFRAFVVVTDASRGAVSVNLVAFGEGTANSAPRQLRSLSLQPGESYALPLARSAASYYGVEVTATGPVLVKEDLAVGGSGVVASAVGVPLR